MEMNSHAYIPKDLNLPDFVPGSLPQPVILAVFLSVSFTTLALVWILSGRLTKTLKIDRVLMCWWVFTGLIHIILMGYFVFSPEFYKDRTRFYLAELWKEYIKGDSRYVGRDPNVVGVEGITAVLMGPASLFTMYAIATKKAYSYALQLSISLWHIYGTAVILITAILEGDNFSASSYYYYAYYITGNWIWVVIPTLICIRCWNKISASFELENRNKVKTR